VIAAQTGTIQAAHVASTGATLLAFLAPVAESDAELSIVAGADVMLGGGVGAGVRESDPELRDKLTAAIQSMKADGSLNALIVKWEIGVPFE